MMIIPTCITYYKEIFLRAPFVRMHADVCTSFLACFGASFILLQLVSLNPLFSCFSWLATTIVQEFLVAHILVWRADDRTSLVKEAKRTTLTRNHEANDPRQLDVLAFILYN
ncbi:hypothetical protein VPH35_098544 [Triticum aestivum]